MWHVGVPTLPLCGEEGLGYGLEVIGATGTEPYAEPGPVLPRVCWSVSGSAVCVELVAGVVCGPEMGRSCGVVLGPCDGGPMSGGRWQATGVLVPG
jgi:hypothetical protein